MSSHVTNQPCQMSPFGCKIKNSIRNDLTNYFVDFISNIIFVRPIVSESPHLGCMVHPLLRRTRSVPFALVQRSPYPDDNSRFLHQNSNFIFSKSTWTDDSWSAYLLRPLRVYISSESRCIQWSYGVMAITLDFESNNPSSNLGRTLLFSCGNVIYCESD